MEGPSGDQIQRTTVPSGAGTTANGGRPGSASAGVMRSALRGQAFGSQLQMLAPRDSGPERARRDAGSGNAPGARGRARTREASAEAPTEATPATPEAAPTEAGVRFTARSERRTPDGHQQNRGRFGVGEMVIFTANKPGDWRASGGSPGDAFGTDELGWQAPAVPGSYTITFTAEGQTVSMTVRVLAPETMTFIKVGERPPASAPVGVVMDCDISFGPRDVSFDAIEWLEKPGPAERATGFWAAGRHPWPGNPDLAHQPNPAATPVGADNTLDNFHDKVSVMTSAPREEWEGGFFEYHIPNVYLVPEVPGSGEHPLPTTRQTHLMAGPDGTVTVRKQGASATRTPSGG